jgi:UDP-N-acetylmuramoylalanine--D-glutamate ligase
MIPVQGMSGQTVMVLGMGRSGLVAAKALQAGGADVRCWDDGHAGRARAKKAGLDCLDPLKNGLNDVSLMVTSPGIPHMYPKPHPAISEALRKGIPVDNDIGLFFRSFATRDWDTFDVAPKIIAVTGSNGKSTTSALIYHLLTVAGRRCQLAGNIGRGVLDLEPAGSGEVIVLELSSYQTELARSLTPDLAVFTNLSPDHLDRHAGYGGYFAAKRRLFSEGGPDHAVIGVDEPEGLYLAAQLADRVTDDRIIRVISNQKPSGNSWQIASRKGFLSESRKGRQVASIDLRQIESLPGPHNHQNACAAYGVLRALHVAPRVIEAGLHSFSGLPHRSQIVRDVKGVKFVNDSKATNVDAASKALAAFANIRWICGGLQKEGGMSGLGDGLANVIKAYAIGREAEAFAMHLEVESEVCTTMSKAVAQAYAQSAPGDVVLLAPATASFDQYDSFEARGEDFMAIVNNLF